ncbi:MAG TPA: hypothetical protein VKX35_03250, partial [Fermentimonas sp.]|nr:hypothetical protein [Fermentimonas sp.]
VTNLGFPKLLIFKPPSLIRKESDRKMEKMGVKVIGFFNRLGLMKSLKPMATDVLAKKMMDAVKV